MVSRGHVTFRSSCLAGTLVAFGRQAAWRLGALVDKLCRKAQFGGAEGRIRSRGSRGGARSRLLPAEKAVGVLDVGISLMCLCASMPGFHHFVHATMKCLKHFVVW